MNESPRTDAAPAQGHPPAPRRRRRWIIGAVALLATVTAFAAFSRSPAFPDVQGRYNEARVELLLDHMLSDASDAQKAEIAAIIKDTMNQVKELRTVESANRHVVVQLLSQPTVDRAELERIRADQVVMVDEASRLITDGLLAASDVLTPEQRAALAERLEKRWE